MKRRLPACTSTGLISVAVLVTLTVGCQKKSDAPSLMVNPCVYIYGDGDPLVGCTVVFVPKQKRNAAGIFQPYSFGVTDELGKVELQTSEEARGVVPGVHWVLISRNAGVDLRFGLLDEIPSRYNTQTELEVEVLDSADQVIELHLKMY